MDAVGVLEMSGVALELNDRILLRHEPAPAHNGPWFVSLAGDGSTSAQLSRPLDFDADGDIVEGMYFYVEEGAKKGKTYGLVSAGPFTLNETALTFRFRSDARAFTQLSDAPPSYAGQGQKGVRVRDDETGLEFAEISALDLTLLDRIVTHDDQILIENGNVVYN